MITLYNENDVRIRDIRIYESNDADMGESTITASVEFDQVMQFHPDWYVLVDGEKYKLGVTEPSGKRSTTQINVKYSLTFHSSREDLKRYTFMDFVEYGSGNPQPSQHTFSIQACTLAQFVSRFNTNLRYYLGSIWTMELSDDADPSIVANLTFDRASIWDVLLDVYSNYGVRWTIQNDNGIMSIIVGKDATELQTIFKYGNGNGLISVERTNPMERIVTRLRGKGSERNLPVNYFHAATSAYPIGDPDTNTVLQGIYYNRLYPKCYRDYVRGYNSGESRTGESWAYQQGVADKVAGKPMNIVDFAKSDKEGLWGISYGAIEDNDAIYPTLQGTTRDGVELDKVLAVSPIYVDAPDDGAASRQFTQVNGDKGSFQGRDIRLVFNYNQDGGISAVVGISNAKSATADSETFTLETSINTVRAKFLVTPTKLADRYASAFGVTDPVSPTLTTVVEMAANNWNFVERLQLINATTGDVVRTWSGNNQDFFDVEADDIPAGTYKFRSYIQWYKTTGTTPDKLLYTIDWQLYGCEFAVYDSELARQSYSDTFDIWIGNIWDTTKRDDESSEDYAFRVWSPLVSKDEMTVMFSDGLLAGEDYEFPIVGAVAEADNLEEIIKKAIHYDTSVTGSHWRLSLKKSDAEFEASGKYLPNSVVNAVAGNHFFFINILMPYDPYVYDAERKQQEYLEEQLALLDVEQPTFAVVPSSVFMASFSEAGDVKPGNKIRLLDTSLIGSSYTTVYIQSVTKRHTENKINPDWSLVVSDQIIVGGNPITLIDGKVEALSRQMYSSKQATRDAIEAMSQFYLRKDGLADTSFSPTDFRAPVTLRDRLNDYNFRQGDFGGYGFGVYTDPNGHRVVEADVLVGRMALRVNEIVVNQVDYVGGQRIYSAAAMTVSRLEETDTIWRCYFDNKQGSVQNLFLVGDLAFCQRFKGTEEGGYTTYWSKVVAIGSDYIELSKTDIMSAGSGSPAVGDNIIQLGNTSDQDRQSAIIMSSYGANSPSLRLYHGINGYSLNNKDMFGVEYDSANQIPYFYNYGSMRLGARTDAEGGFITYNHISKQLNIKAVVNFLPQSTGLEQMEAYQKLVQIAQGNIETWFHDDVTPAQTGAPTLTNYPVNSWESADYENHIGDIYYSDTGKGYRFKRNGNSWAWEIISDAELAQIMAEVQNLQYLKAALGQDTTVAGGLILTSLIQLGYKDAQDIRHTMAGISGLGQNDRGIAAWFGGPMVDHELNPTATDYAKSLFRFDGTGYLAKGNITWDANGYGQVGGSGDRYAIKWNDNGIFLGSGIKITESGQETLATLLEAVTELQSWFGEDEHGDIYIKNDENGRARGFYTNSFLSAGGKGESSSGGGSADYTQWGWDDIIQLTSDPGLGNLASAWALKQEYDSRQSALSVLSQGLSSIRLLIPSSASESNQLADKEFVNSSIASNTATFRGTFEGVSYLPSGAKLNDYAFVIATDASGNPEYNRYKYTASGWVFEYTLNNSSFTAEQWSAITSGITANLVSLYSGHIANQSNPHAVTKAQIGLGDVENIKLSSWTGSTSITTLGAVTTGEWKASKIANDYLVNSSIRIGSTTVSLGGAIEALSGIASISLKGNNDAKLVYDNGAWHLSGNLLVDGYITAGGVGSSSGGGGIDSAAMWALLGDATGEQINKTHIASALEGYQTIIPDLATIRNNAANGNTAYGWGNHSGKYLPLSGGTMSNTNVVTNLNADLLDGYHADSFPKNVYLGKTDLNSINYDCLCQQTGNANATSDRHYPINEAGSLISVSSANSSTNQIYGAYNSNRWFARGSSGGSTVRTAWREFAFTDSNVASASKWAAPRTITLTGSVTGSVSIDGSGDVSLATTTNHTHSFASLTSKPTTISGYGITDALTTANYNSYAPTLTGGGASGTWGINISGNAATANNADTLDGYHASYFATAISLGNYLPLSGGTLSNPSFASQLTINRAYSGGDAVIKFTNGNNVLGYIGVRADNTPVFYGTDTSGNGNCLIHSGNYNSYAPTLTGGGASGTWGISISGNAATATNADTLDGYHESSFPKNVYLGKTDLNSINYDCLCQQTGNVNATSDRHYPINEAGSLISVSSANSSTNQIYGAYNSNRWFARGSGGGSTVRTAWREFAFTDSNVASATKLQTARTIWGQSFDGTGDIGGPLNSVTGITFSSEGAIMNLNGLQAIDLMADYINIGYGYAIRGKNTFVGGNNIYLRYGTSQTVGLFLNSSGNVGIGTTSPSEKLHVIGNILASGAITAGTASDSRLKSNIATLCNASSVLRQLRGVGFDWNAIATDKSSYFKGHDVGLIAQEVEPLIPSAIGTIWGEYKRLDYAKITPYLVEGWKEHDTEINRLRKRVTELEDEVNKLRKYVN